uniref:SecY-type transporter protein n=1 Tax=Reclinomonas americana TaxID=48483 RepID=O21257_RECAM|nr:SecY-type transporter protein [Reclinomonas americana]AAD11884.1 SecY-type transporter protein [Reclinomonas americana]
MSDKKEMYIKILFTLFIVLLTILLRNIMLPGISLNDFTNKIETFEIISIVNGNNKYSLFALNITPIITYLFLEQLYYIYSIPLISKKKNLNKDLIKKYSVYIFLMISYLEGFIYLNHLYNTTSSSFLIFYLDNTINYLLCLNFLVIGSCFLYFFAKLINIYGIGKGLSFIIFINIVGSFIDIFYKYLIQIETLNVKYLVFLLFVQCLFCGIIYFYIDFLFLKIPIIKLNFVGNENDNYNYLNYFQKYQTSSLNLLGILPFILVYSIIYMLKLNLNSFLDLVFNIFLEMLCMMFIYLFLSRFLKKYLKFIYNINKNNIYIEHINKNIYSIFFISHLYYLGILRDYCLFCFLFIFSKLFFIISYLFIEIDFSFFSLYEMNNTFMFLYLILFRILLIIYERIKYITFEKKYQL